MFPKINWDAMGITASILCAIHCAVLPLAVATLPLFGVNIIHNPVFENGMIGLAFIIGTRALWHGFRFHHHRLTPWFIFLVGMILLIAKQVWHSWELLILPFAVLGIVAAHLLNFRWSKGHVHGGGASAAPSGTVVSDEPGGGDRWDGGSGGGAGRPRASLEREAA